MTKGEYPYPPDEFDTVDPSAGPRGVHRRPPSRWATVWPYLAALVASAVLAVVVIGFLWDERGIPPVGGVTEAAGDVPDPAATEASPAPTPTAPATEPVAEPSPEPPATTPEPPPPAPDLATPVAVYNSTSVRGLAAEAAETLEDAGWTRVQAGNFAGGTLPASTVRYGAPELEVSARAVAEALGISRVELADAAPTDGIEVVLERDHAG